MANTIITPQIFAREVIRNRDRKITLLTYANRDYEWELKRAWDAVNVQTLPSFTLTPKSIAWAWDCVTSKVWTWPWQPIVAEDVTIKKEKLVIDQYTDWRITLTDHEKIQSNLDLTFKLAERYSVAEKELVENEILDLILNSSNIPTANKINDWSPVTLTKANIYEEIEKMRVALQMQNVTENLVLACTPYQFSMLLQSNVLDYHNLGYEDRLKGKLRLISGVDVVPTTAITGWQMIMFQEKAFNLVIQMNKTDVRRWVDGFYENVIAEIIWWKKIFDENAKAIAINYATA